MYKPKTPFNVAAQILIPTYSDDLGVDSKVYPTSGNVIFCSFRTFGGTEITVDGLYSIENTAVVETWYNPEIQSNVRLKIMQTGDLYEVFGEPENIEMRNQFMKIRVRAVKGGV